MRRPQDDSALDLNQSPEGSERGRGGASRQLNPSIAYDGSASASRFYASATSSATSGKHFVLQESAQCPASYNEAAAALLPFESSSSLRVVPRASSQVSDRKRKRESAEEEERSAEAESSRYKCRFCGQCFPRSQALGGHMNRHRQEREQEQLKHARYLLEKDCRFAPILPGFSRLIGTNSSSSCSSSATFPNYYHQHQHQQENLYQSPSHFGQFVHNTQSNIINLSHNNTTSPFLRNDLPDLPYASGIPAPFSQNRNPTCRASYPLYPAYGHHQSVNFDAAGGCSSSAVPNLFQQHNYLSNSSGFPVAFAAETPPAASAPPQSFQEEFLSTPSAFINQYCHHHHKNPCLWFNPLISDFGLALATETVTSHGNPNPDEQEETRLVPTTCGQRENVRNA